MDKNSLEKAALEAESQSTFLKAMKTIKKMVKSGEVKIHKEAPKSGPAGPAAKKTKGAVYLSHVPHGFYEEQMNAFFSQFGEITRLKLGRSKKSGRSKGYAFIEFVHKEVAQIVAETMNNYLMFTRLLKAEYIPPEKLNESIFFGRKINAENYPAKTARNLNRRITNRVVTSEQAAKKKSRAKKKLRSMQARLNHLGIDYKIQHGGDAALVPPLEDTPTTAGSKIVTEPKLSEKKPKKVKPSKVESPKKATATLLDMGKKSTPRKLLQSPKISKNKGKLTESVKASPAKGDDSLTSEKIVHGETPKQVAEKKVKPQSAHISPVNVQIQKVERVKPVAETFVSGPELLTKRKSASAEIKAPRKSLPSVEGSGQLSPVRRVTRASLAASAAKKLKKS